MSQLAALFHDFTRTRIRPFVKPVDPEQKEQILQSLLQSPFRSVVQAWSVLDFYDYRHWWAEGFDTYFGYSNAFITADYILDLVHPEDQEAFGQLYYLCLQGLLSLPIPTAGIGHFCIRYRMRKKDGSYLPILETNNILACDAQNGFPLVNLAQISILEGSELGKPVQYYFNIKDEGGSIETMRGWLSQYDSNPHVFSENEIKMARLLKQGMTSNEIADKIFLSKHTIDKYRKNLLEKTQTRNTPQLVDYLSRLGLI